MILFTKNNLHFIFRSLLLLVLVGYSSSAHAQGYFISGNISDQEYEEELIGASILLLKLPDSTQVNGVISDIDGSFRLSNIESGDYILRVSYIGYGTQEKKVSIKKSSLRNIDIELVVDAKVLQETQIEGLLPRVVLKGDTTEMNADAYKVNPDADASDLVKKMPGIIIQDGKVQAQGENVKRVLLDNKEFFGDDAIMTLKNLPADIVSKIQVYDQVSDQSELSGFDDGETEKVINIVTRVEMNDGVFGRVYGGYALDNKFSAGGNVNYFKEERRLSFVGLSNNINVQNFSGEDLVGVASSSMKRPKSRGGSPRGGSGVGDFLQTDRGGVSTTHGVGLNYVEEWKKGVKVTGSYFYNRLNNDNNSFIEREYFAEDFQQFYRQNGNSQSFNNNHRINAKIDYDIDDNKSIKITPKFSFQNNSSNNYVNALSTLLNGEALNKSENDNSTIDKGYNFSNSILYKHKLRLPKRTFSVRFNTSLNNRLTDNFLTAQNFYSENIDSLILQDQWTDGLNKSLTLSGKAVFSEPIGEKSQIKIEFEPAYTTSSSDKKTYQYNEATNDYTIIDYSLSNEFENINWTNQAGIGYKYGGKDFSVNVGVDYRNTVLSSDKTFPIATQIDKKYNNFLPSARFNYKFSARSRINLFYRTNLRAPTVSQLQDVIDNSNPLILSGGNKDLDQQYSHSIGMRWRFANPLKGNSAFIFISGGLNNNYITNATLLATKDTMINDQVLLPKGGQYTQPVNVNGNWNLRGFLNYGTPLLFMKSNLNLVTGFTYNRIPNLINGSLQFNNTYNFNSSIFIGSNISENIDFSLSYRANYNIVKYSQNTFSSNNYFTGNVHANVTVLPWKGMVLNSDIIYSHYVGLGDDFNRNFALWNASVGYKFLKKSAAMVSLQVFDILGTNNSISREVTETYVQDSRVDVLGRYFMLQFSYKFNKYNIGSSSSSVDF